MIETEPSKNIQEVEKAEEDDKNNNPSLTQMETMKAEESDEKKLEANDIILMSLKKITLFFSDLLMSCDQEAHQQYIEDHLSEYHASFLDKLSRTHPLVQVFLQEGNGILEYFITILEHLVWTPTNFEINHVAKTVCNRCKTNTEFSPVLSYGISIIANSLRETKYAFPHFSFENILKVVNLSSKMHCAKEGCGKQSYVQRLIDKNPFIFTIALEWENNETEREIFDTFYAIAAQIDLTKIYQYRGDSSLAKYNFVSMVCIERDQFICIACENNILIKYYHSGEAVILDSWRSIRPVILFFENVVKRQDLMERRQELMERYMRFEAPGRWDPPRYI